MSVRQFSAATPSATAGLPPPRPPSGGPRRRSKTGSAPYCEDTPYSSRAQDNSEVMKLKEENAELRARCDWQAQALKDLRQSSEDVEYQPIGSLSVPAPRPFRPTATGSRSSCSNRRLAPVPGRMCNQESQTDEMEEMATEQHLEAIKHKNRTAHLEGQLRMQEKIIGQYKTEIDSLEEQLRIALSKQLRAEQERDVAERCARTSYPAKGGRASPCQISRRASPCASPRMATRSFCMSQAWGDATPKSDEGSTRAPTPQSITVPTPTSTTPAASQRPMSARTIPSHMVLPSPRAAWRGDDAFEESASSDDDDRPSTARAMKMASLKIQLENAN